MRSILGRGDEAAAFFVTAYAMCLDMYKTFVPIKRTTFAMTMAAVELTARMTGQHLDKVQQFAEARPQYKRGAVAEAVLDILDLYVQHHRSTKLGQQFDLNKFIDIKIHINNELDKVFEPRHMYTCRHCETQTQPPTPTSPHEVSSLKKSKGQDGTMRFIFAPEAARKETDTIDEHFKEEYEEYEVEVEEPVPPPPERPNGHRGGYRGGGYRGDRRGGPYGGHRGDRHRGRGRYH